MGIRMGALGGVIFAR
ncbi:hypothetical protein Hamer_G029723 [Homarus americanus]|uniref:Uncharacterized protein n=1 Tax=Homarus americanus TaxID=6706 RepID=A0A8J5JSX5_HOMAM|nr:hypothetical protein Hamer_G011235 [Homarus americanus]KAG7169818.1 hypothetical protein Hamer_G029723 [Homarus americanus]